MAKSDFQTVRTTAYTHTEDDHLAYGARNALGGVLQSATVPTGLDQRPRRALPVTDVRGSDDLIFARVTRDKSSAHSKKKKESTAKTSKRGNAGKTAKTGKTKNGKIAKAVRVRKPEPPRIGSAAADWSRWPVGTTFRVLSTGQTYRVDDYGWALAGRNTIDLYMSSRRDMNTWGVRHEPIQILKWGSPEQSLALLQHRQSYKHCRRMALELQGLHEQAAALQ
jgi:3D (Asp-Asp-Asp) domain-containing protein